MINKIDNPCFGCEDYIDDECCYVCHEGYGCPNEDIYFESLKVQSRTAYEIVDWAIKMFQPPVAQELQQALIAQGIERNDEEVSKSV